MTSLNEIASGFYGYCGKMHGDNERMKQIRSYCAFDARNRVCDALHEVGHDPSKKEERAELDYELEQIDIYIEAIDYVLEDRPRELRQISSAELIAEM